MRHTIKPERDDDGGVLPAVIIEAPDLIWLQVANPEWEDEAASDEDRTFTPDERIMESDVPYVPLARAERAEAENAMLRAQVTQGQPLDIQLERRGRWLNVPRDKWRPAPPPERGKE